MTLYCIWWLLKEPFYIQVTEVTFHCWRGVCRGKRSGLDNLRKVSALLFRNLTSFSQGHSMTVFCKISVRRRRLRISRWTFHSCTIFEPSLINSLRFSEVWFFIFYYTGYTISYLPTSGDLKSGDSLFCTTLPPPNVNSTNTPTPPPPRRANKLP